MSEYKDGSYRHAAEAIYKTCKESNLDYDDKIAIIDYIIYMVVRKELSKRISK